MRRSVNEWLELIDKWIKEKGKLVVRREEVAAEFNITVNYAGDLLRQYAVKRNLLYHRGILYVRRGVTG